ncbi:MAG: HNH endonuclease [Anaerolineaceae bacterium 4572_5.1]|nr:MAG: HNH endonuclease [Anaerolineaceae bacterium 4572_5.1]RLD03611.1 MAG: HNH endonuclease [Chloroflexota bacterium]
MNEPVLVLNGNYAPISVCTTRRAMGLLVIGKANMILDGRGVVHTVSRTFPKPSIIRLQKIIKRPRPCVKLTKREILRRDNYRCQYCGRSSATLTVDHIVPQHLGGESTWENLVTACAECNHKKGGRSLAQSGLILRTIPKRPPNSAKYLFGKYLNRYEEWEPFIKGW